MPSSDHRRRWLAGCVIIGLAALATMSWRTLAPPPRQLAWFWDEANGSLFAAPADEIAPIIAPSGGRTGVLAYVIRIDGSEQPSVVYLQSRIPTASDASDPLAGVVVKRPEDAGWTAGATPAAAAIRNRAAQLAGGRPYTVDLPTSP